MERDEISDFFGDNFELHESLETFLDHEFSLDFNNLEDFDEGCLPD